MQNTQMNKRMLAGFAAVVLAGFVMNAVPADAGDAKVLAALDVAPVWSTHNTGTPVLLTSGEYQYVLYYDKDRHVALAQRKLASDTWNCHTFQEVLGWAHGAHCNLSLAIDKRGLIHASAYNRGFSKTHAGPIYYRSEMPHDISRWTTPPITTVPVPCYPTFIQSADNKLMYKFRQGSAVKGDNLWTVYDEDAGKWQPCRVLTAGIADNRYAYNNMVLGPDGYVHVAYLWADASTPDNFNNISYIRSEDLVSWETAAGEKLTLPITHDTTATLANPVPHNKGNVGLLLSFDGKNRPIISNSNFDETGNNQIYNSRFENGAWNIVQATDWDYRNRWAANDISIYMISVGSVRPLCEGKLLQTFKHVKYGEGFIVLDEKTLKPLGSTHEYTLVPSAALKLTRTITASSELAGFEATKAIDADNKTRWQPKPDDKEPWLELDFGREITFEHFSLMQLRLNILAFELQYWDGVKWKEAYTSTKLQTTYHGVDWMYPLRPITTSKVRLVIKSFLQKPTPHERKGELPVPAVCRFDVYAKEPNRDYPKHLKDLMVPWPVELEKQESSFTLRPMTVDWVEDAGSIKETGAKYYLRWEHGPANRDLEVPQPWPDPTMLRVYKLKTINPESYASELLKAIK